MDHREDEETLLRVEVNGERYGTVENGQNDREQDNRIPVNISKGLKICAKWILHIAYIRILVGSFGGLISEFNTLKECPKFTGIFLILFSLFWILICIILCIGAYTLYEKIHSIFTIFLYMVLITNLAVDIYISFLPPVHWIGDFSTNETWPQVQEWVSEAMNWSIPQYSSVPFRSIWDTIQTDLGCCGVEMDFPWGGWKDLGKGWKVPPSCCISGYENECMKNPSNTTSYIGKGCLPEVMPFVKIVLFVVRIVLFYCLTFSIAVFKAISQERNPRGEGRRRLVKLGRSLVPPVFQHWAVQVANVDESEEGHWYEIGREGFCISHMVSRSPGYNIVTRGKGREAISSAGRWGGEIVGWTIKSDEEILGAGLSRWIANQPTNPNVHMKSYMLRQEVEIGYRKVRTLEAEAQGDMIPWTDEAETAWIKEWIMNNSMYTVEGDNCQKFAYELIVWLTDGVFTVPHRFDVAKALSVKGKFGGFSAYKGGSRIDRYGSGDQRVALAPFGIRYRWTEFQSQIIFSPCNPGLGVFGDASIMRLEVSLGNIIGLHIDYNINSGLGVRNGNFEAHFLGFGGKLGGDGIEINTPVGGANACSIM